jgi:hypothetical protein
MPPSAAEMHDWEPVQAWQLMPFEPQASFVLPLAHEPVSSQHPVQLSELQTIFGFTGPHDGATATNNPTPTPTANACRTLNPTVVFI